MKSSMIKFATVAALILAPTASVFAADAVTANSAGLIQKLPANQLASKLGNGSAMLVQAAMASSDSVYVISVPDVYSATDSRFLNHAEVGIDTYQIQQLQADLASDSSVSAWLSSNGADVGKVVAVVKNNGSLNIYVGA